MRESNVFEKLLQQLDDKFVGFDTQIEKLSNILDTFAKTNEGGSALIFGPPSCGKFSIIRKHLGYYQNAYECLQLVMKYASDMEVVFIDGLLHTSDASAVRVVDELELQLKKPYIVVILNLEQFVVRANQILLYKVLDATLFQDCSQLLEKRVRSRLSNISLSFAQSEITVDDFSNAFRSFLQMIPNSSYARTHNRSLEEFLKELSVKDVLTAVYKERRSYGLLKQLTATFICFLLADGINSISNTPECCSILMKAKEAILPSEDVMESTISSLTLRQLCLLTCCVRLVRNHRQKEFTYRSIIQSYRRLTNSYLAALSVNDDMILYKELDTLSDLALLERSLTFTGQLAFRRTSLQVDDELVIKCLKSFSPLPVAISQWLEDLDK
ncbi:unnamed protein product [Toxocara canis]|uniref:Origin recognition complex subunit 4 n=1 Tax=Toxocara canis TaxID=6265 RepID=A0A183V5U1_TOXCA|nr:unnamed protein product [Toxocara canis]